jgi:hypothetical protein
MGSRRPPRGSPGLRAPRTPVRYASLLSTTPDQIVAFVEAHAGEPVDVDYLLTWIALRTDHAVHQAGERSSIERLRFVCEHWLSAEERALLMVWLRRRVAAGKTTRPPLPGSRQAV